MVKKNRLIKVAFVAAAIAGALAPCFAEPVVSNVTAQQRAGTRLVDINYDLASDRTPLTVTVAISTNSGATYDLPATSLSGDVGAGIMPGMGKSVVWDAGADWPHHYSDQMRARVTADDGWRPPNPSNEAPTPSNGVVTLFSSSVAFLYSGTNPVQIGVSNNAINNVQIAVLRGRVIDTNNNPLAQVKIEIEGHPEYGTTLTRSDGMFDMAVNGGEPLKLNFSKTDYLPIQRVVNTPWHNAIVLDDIVLKSADTKLTRLGMTVAGLRRSSGQAASGNTVADNSGQRTARVFFPAGTEAYIITAAGETQQVATLTTRFTEFTVGSNGPSAMPGDLPETVGYTYAVELGALEAELKVAGKDVLFNQDVYFYVDNFLGMPVGTLVPAGYYDDAAGAWIPSPNGLVIGLLGTNSAGLAEIDIAGSGTPANDADLAALGFTPDERAFLAATFSATQTLWRTPIRHFSRWDCNFPVAAEPGSQQPNTTPPQVNNNGSVHPGSTQGGAGEVELENQVFREAVPIPGTPFKLTYSSRNALGYASGARVTIPLTGATYPTPLKGIELTIEIAGRTFTYEYAPATNLQHVFTWDGRDSYGNYVRGSRKAVITVAYLYDAYYTVPPPDWAIAAFGLPGRTELGVKARTPARLARSFEVYLTRSSPVFSLGLGGWLISPHHIYDPYLRALLTGDGKFVNKDLFRTERRTYGQRQEFGVIATIAGTGTAGYSGDGGPAAQAQINTPVGLRAAPDGSLYFADSSNHCVRKISVGGTITTVAGTGTAGYSGDGGPATSARLNEPRGVFPLRDGTLYIADYGNGRVRCIAPNGIITTVAGGGFNQPGDGLPATNAYLPGVSDVVLARDGTMYIAAAGHARVHRVSPDGLIYTYAGTGTNGYSGDGSHARLAKLDFPQSLALAPDGSLYVGGAPVSPAVRKIGPDGIITTVAGDGMPGYYGDGGIATNAGLQAPRGIALTADGTLIIADDQNRCLRAVGSDGLINRIAGRGNPFIPNLGDGGPARNAQLEKPLGVAVSADGEIFIADTDHHRIRRIGPVMANIKYVLSSIGTTFIASDDGRFLYEIDENARHTATYDAETCAQIYNYTYSNGLITAITDADGNTTTIQRSSDGTPTAIIAPDGLRTELDIDENNYLHTLTKPNGDTLTFTYTTDGLLTRIQSQRGAEYNIYYDTDGRVISLSNPLGQTTTYTRVSTSNAFAVAMTSAVGHARNFAAEDLVDGSRRRTITFPDASSRVISNAPDGVQVTVEPNGLVQTVTYGADPRLGLQAPYQLIESNRWPSSRTLIKTQLRTAATVDDNPLTLQALTNITVINNKTNQTVFNTATRQRTTTTAAGRQYVTTVDTQNQPIRIAAPGLAAITNHYDSRGRLIRRVSSADGVARSESYSYATNGFLSTVTNGLGEVTGFQYDGAGRLTRITRPDSQAIALGYDTHGNRTSIVTAAGQTHSFTFDLADHLTAYLPPDAGGQPGAMTFAYNADGQLTTINLADGRAVTNVYDGAGRLVTRKVARGSYAISYQPGGLMAKATAPDGAAVSNIFDGDLLTSTRWSGPVTGVVNFAYDSDLHLSIININGQMITNLFYDADGLLTNAGALIIQRRPADGFVTSTVLGAVTESCAYNGFGELTNYSAAISGEVFYTYALQYDALGRLTNKTEIFALYSSATNQYAYTYDSLGRLTAVATNGGTASTYQYDRNGNCTNAARYGSAYSCVYDARDRLVSWHGATSGTNYFNAHGQLTNRVEDGNATEFVYDELGNLLEVKLPGSPGTNISYVVDGLQRRVGKLADGVFTQGFLYQDDQRIAAELDANTNVISVFIYGVRQHTPEYMIRTGAVYRIISDQLGSPRRIVNIADGTIVQELDYDEFGLVIRDTNPGFQPFGFAGGLYDPDTGLVRFGVRDYDPVLARWTTRDPALFGGNQFNLYAYCGNDPINRTDFTGAGPGWTIGDYGTANDLLGVGLNFLYNFDVPNQLNTPLGVLGIGISAYQTVQSYQDPNANFWDRYQNGVLTGVAIVSTFGGPEGAVIGTAVTITHYGSQAVFWGGWQAWAAWETRPSAVFSDSALRRLQGTAPVVQHGMPGMCY